MQINIEAEETKNILLSMGEYYNNFCNEIIVLATWAARQVN